jgi:hypothetical protein
MASKRPRRRQDPLKLDAADHVGITAISEVIFQLGQKFLKARYNHDCPDINLLDSILLLMTDGLCFAKAYTL